MYQTGFINRFIESHDFLFWERICKKGFSYYENSFETGLYNIKPKGSVNIYKYMTRFFQGVDDTDNLFFSDKSIDEKYENQLGNFEYIDNIDYKIKSSKKCTIYMATSHVDKEIESDFYSPCTKKIQVGAALTNLTIANIKDNSTEDNISLRNRDYCEMSAVYWMWKNDLDSDYIGLCHYRRLFVITEEMLNYFMNNNYDVIYTLPKITEEGIREEFVERNYFLLPETWNYISTVLEELSPDYMES